MSKGEDYRCRLSVEVMEEDKEIIAKYIPWGSITHVYRVLTHDLALILEKLSEKQRAILLGGILSDSLKLEQYSKRVSSVLKEE